MRSPDADLDVFETFFSFSSGTFGDTVFSALIFNCSYADSRSTTFAYADPERGIPDNLVAFFRGERGDPAMGRVDKGPFDHRRAPFRIKHRDERFPDPEFGDCCQRVKCRDWAAVSGPPPSRSSGPSG